MKISRSFVSAAIVLAISSSSAQAVVWSTATTDQALLTFGTDPRFAGVGYLVGRGTATYLGTNAAGQAWGITAKHIAGQGASGSFQFFGETPYTFTDTVEFAGADVSVFRIQNWDRSLPNLALHTSGMYTPGTEFISAGYGTHAAEDGSDIGFDQRRRGFQTVLDSFRPNDPSLWFEPQPFLMDRFDAPGDPNARPLEGFGAGGDSGSPLLDSQNRLWGVLTNGQVERFGNLNWYATITPDLANQIALTTGLAVPTPPAAVAFLGAALIATRRRR